MKIKIIYNKMKFSKNKLRICHLSRMKLVKIHVKIYFKIINFKNSIKKKKTRLSTWNPYIYMKIKINFYSKFYKKIFL